ncbi:hypothetical protein [Sandaracinus amylolyticus]|uniref:hypothetical protein n=1 Tax=Sandaracinus amylolyticus TaxID=927083 RepID=UPI00069D3F30|nr:hypothetical protein [Sandaracinus amylolyticus]
MPPATYIVQKLWNLCRVRRDDGITYRQYAGELTWLLILKMPQGTQREWQLLKCGSWADPEQKDGIELLTFSRNVLLHLGTQSSPRVQPNFANASTSLKSPIDDLEGYSKTDALGEMYERLFEKNASERRDATCAVVRVGHGAVAGGRSRRLESHDE